MSINCFNLLNDCIRYNIALYQIQQGCHITLNFHGNYLSHKHIIVQSRSYCIAHVLCCDINNLWVCWSLGLFTSQHLYLTYNPHSCVCILNIVNYKSAYFISNVNISSPGQSILSTF